MRTLKLVIEDGGDALSTERYADIAHAVWSAAQAALPGGGFWLEHDGKDSNEDLNDRWDEQVRESPWH